MPNQDYCIKDYELNMLLEDRNNFSIGTDRESQGLAYFYNRSIIQYMARLLFAIGWSKIRPHATNEVNQFIYSKLFMDPRQHQKESIEPGRFGYYLGECARMLSKEDVVEKEKDLLRNLGLIRNLDAHEILSVNTSEFFKNSDKVFREFAELFDNKICAYIIPYENCGEDQIRCKKLSCNENYPKEIFLQKSTLDWSRKGNRFYYQITDCNTLKTEYFCLSPFIEAPAFIGGSRPHFRIYDGVKNTGYGTECDTLRYYSVVPKNLYPEDSPSGEQLHAEFDKTTAEFSRYSLFENCSPDSENNLWHPSISEDVVYINISSYPGFGDILTSKYKYCFDICPVRKDVLDFCEDKNKQVAQITGNGGVGKTALVLSIISELLMKKSIYHYTNLIFLSAKKKYYTMSGNTFSPQDYEKEADIHNFNDLINKIANLLGVQCESADINRLADEIVREINDRNDQSESEKQFLLVIDDLDSLSNSDQTAIDDFIYRLNSHVFKTIVTTRNIAASSPVSYNIGELASNESQLYAKWYAEEILGIPSWNSWNRKRFALDWIEQCGEGNPLTIQMLLVLVKSGMEEIYDSPSTQNERTAYLYNTVQNLLTDEEKKIFEICRNLYISLQGDDRNQDMLLLVPEYLSAGCNISSSIFEKSVNKLVQLKLITRTRNGLQFKPYSAFILSNSVVLSDTKHLPDMYQLIWENVRQNPTQWLTIHDVETVIVTAIIDADGHNGFDNIVARCIMERICNKDHIYSALKERIREWLEKHSSNAENEIQTRLIQRIENTWKTIKDSIDNNREDEAAEIRLGDDIRQLNKMLEKENNPVVSGRLAVIRNELNEYDL